MITVKQISNNRIQVRGKREDWAPLKKGNYIKIVPTITGFRIEKCEKPMEKNTGVGKLVETGTALFTAISQKGCGFTLSRPVEGMLRSTGHDIWELKTNDIAGNVPWYKGVLNVGENSDDSTIKTWLKEINHRIISGEMEASIDENGGIALWVKRRL